MCVNFIWLAFCVICHTVLTGLVCVSVAIKQSVASEFVFTALLVCVCVCMCVRYCRGNYISCHRFCEVGTYVLGIRV